MFNFAEKKLSNFKMIAKFTNMRREKAKIGRGIEDSIIKSNSKSCQIEIIRLNSAKVLEFLIEFGQSCKVDRNCD